MLLRIYSLAFICIFGLTICCTGQTEYERIRKQQDKLLAEQWKLRVQIDEEKTDSLRIIKIDHVQKLGEEIRKLGETCLQIELSETRDQLKKNIPDSAKFPLLEKLATYYNGIFIFDSALMTENTLLTLAQKNNSPLYEVKALGFFCQTYDYSRQFSLALEYLKRSLALA